MLTQNFLVNMSAAEYLEIEFYLSCMLWESLLKLHTDAAVVSMYP